MLCRLSWAFAVVIVSASSVVADEQTIQTGDHFRVICHFNRGKVPQQVLEIAEAVWPMANELLGTPDKPLDRPLDIHLYRWPADYRKVEAELTGGRTHENLAFASAETRAAHIALQPDCSNWVLDVFGLPALTRRMIAQEAVHLYRCALLPNHASHPDWLGDGLAAWVAEQVMRRAQGSLGDEDDPLTATYMVDAQRRAAQGRLPSVEQLLCGRLGDVGTRTREGMHYLFFRFMQTEGRRDTWKKVLEEAGRLSGGPDYGERLRAFVEQTLGPAGYKALHEDWQRYVRELKPQWEEVRRSLGVAFNALIQFAYADTDALAWNTAPVDKDEYVLRGKLQILPDKVRQMRLLLGRNDTGYVSVEFVASEGVVVSVYHAREDRWEELGRGPARYLGANDWADFAVAVRGGQLDVSVNGRKVSSVALGGRSMRGRWGLGTPAYACGVWRELELR